ncbi:DinB family protein [Amycolatopsis sp. OK19-0408]|uniref:DinB family protein n=1 Tax=Amycolatopsis iheyensis TaxID=2945988 RepID=A0A9X2NJS0_9PSEU|nr:DinB family protein [Amycolatopsis iheyensis]MCR6487667.1 DinB family protein [Amycolatopsis iheyensis]
MTREHDDLLGLLAEVRSRLLIPARDVSDADASRRTTVSELTLGGLIRHLATGERMWLQVLSSADGSLPEGMLDTAQYTMSSTLAHWLAEYSSAAAATDSYVRSLPSLDVSVQLPTTPWSPPEPQFWTARRIVLHLIHETAQHAGHADIIRESLDGANSTAQLA